MTEKFVFGGAQPGSPPLRAPEFVEDVACVLDGVAFSVGVL